MTVSDECEGSPTVSGTLFDPPAFQVLESKDLIPLKAELLAKAGAQVAAFPERLEALQELMRTVYPPHLIAVVAGWGLRTAVGPKGVSGAGMIRGVQQHHAELLQALALALPADEWGVEPASPADIQSAIDHTLELAEAFSGQRLLAAEGKSNRQARAILGLQERLRTHTQVVRNWGRYSEMLRILRDLYAPLDDLTRDRFGYGVLDVIAVVRQTVTTLEQRVNGRFRLLKDIFAAPTIETLVRDFFARFPGVAGDPDAFLAELDERDDLASVRFRLHVHADQWLVSLAVAPVGEIAEAVGLPEAVVSAVFDRLSLFPGALAEDDPHHVFLANPVWTRPGVKTGDAYFFAFPQTAASFLNDILRAMCQEAGLATKLERRRAVYLEREVAEVFRAALPGAEITPAAGWTWGGANFETDVLVRLDRSVIIAECKSASLSSQALRGAPDRAKRHIGELIVEPAMQSARLARVIDAARNGDEAALTVSRGLGLEPEDIDTVIRMSVTLDDLSVLASAEAEMKTAAWIPPDLELATTINIADLACVADILQRPSQFLHYFSERGRLQRSADIFGFELDFLGLYLQTGFHIDRSPEIERIAITEMSQPIDIYYQNFDVGHASEKPQALLAPMFEKIIDALEVRRPNGWTTMALGLLQMGAPDEQQDCADMLDQLREEVRATYRDPEHRNAFIFTPTAHTGVAIVFHVFPDVLGPERNRTIQRLVSHVLHVSGLRCCVYVSRLIERWDKPYSAIGMAIAP